MTTPSNQIHALSRLATEAASVEASAATTAAQLVMAEILKLMIEKGIASREELDRRLTVVELAASQARQLDPMLHRHVTTMTLTLRHALGLESSSRN